MQIQFQILILFRMSFGTSKISVNEVRENSGRLVNDTEQMKKGNTGECETFSVNNVMKGLLGGTIKEMMEAETEDHLGYEKSERSDSDDYRNGYKRKKGNSRYGSMGIEVPQDRKSTFEPQVVKKRRKDISDIDQKIISMYAKGMRGRTGGRTASGGPQ